MDFADKKAVKYFLKDNGIEDLTQLKLVFKSMAGSLLDELLEGERDDHLGYANWVTPNMITSTKRLITQGMDILQRMSNQPMAT